MHAIPTDIGKIIKPIAVIDRVIEVDVAPVITIVSTDSNIVFRVLYFSYLFFWFMVFVFEVRNHFFNVVNWVIKTIYII